MATTAYWNTRRKTRQKITPLWRYLPWHVTLDRARGIFATTDGGFLCGFTFTPKDLSSLTEPEQSAIMLRLNTAKQQMLPGSAIWVRGVHTPDPIVDATEWDHPVARLLHEERLKQMGQPGGLWRTRVTYWFWHKPEPRVATWLKRLFVQERGTRRHTVREGMEAFWTGVNRVVSVMRGGSEAITALDSTAALTELHAIVAPFPHRVHTPSDPRTNVSVLLAREANYYPGLRPMLGTVSHLQAIRCLSFTEDMPVDTYAGMLRGVNTLPLAWESSIRFVVLDREEASKQFTNSQFNWKSTQHGIRALVHELYTHEQANMSNRYVDRQADDSDQANDEMRSQSVIYGQTVGTFVVRDQDHRVAEEGVRAIETILHTQGVMTRDEDDNCDDAWFSTHPGNPYANVGELRLSSLNALHLMPLQQPYQGPDGDAHLKGPAWFTVTTDGHTRFNVVNHVNDNGMYKVIGPTRSGKSTLANLMVASWTKYPGAQVSWWDIDGSARCLTLCLGGQWHHVGADGIGYQPYADIDDPAELGWAFEWTLKLIKMANIALTEVVQGFVSSSLRRLAKRPPCERTMTGLLLVMVERSPQEELMRPKQSALHEAMERERTAVRNVLKEYLADGPHGNLFDACEDHLGHPWLRTYEQATLLRRGRLIDPITSLLFHREERTFDTRHPLLMLMDDAAVTWAVSTESALGSTVVQASSGMIRSNSFQANSKQWLVTTAKKNVSIGFFTHSLTQVFESPLGDLLIESCPTTFALPNATARTPQIAKIYDKMGYNEREIDIISSAQAQREVYYSADAYGKRLCRIELPDVCLAVFARNRQQDHQRMDDILDHHGPDDFAYHWYMAEGFPDAARRVQRAVELERPDLAVQAMSLADD